MFRLYECLVMQAFLLNETKVRKDKFLYYEGIARVHVHCSSSTRVSIDFQSLTLVQKKIATEYKFYIKRLKTEGMFLALQRN